MVYVIIICALSCAGMIAFALLKPKITIGRLNLSTYWFAPLLGALLLFAFQFIGFSEAFERLTANTAINPLKILVLFIAMTVLSVFLDETGFFRYLASAVLKKTASKKDGNKASQIKLFTVFYIMISVLTVFTSNDIIILTFTPFICYFAKNAKIDPVPYLIAEFVAANTASMLLIIGNPTNIYLAAASGIDFLDYLRVMALPALFAAVAAYAVMLLLFYKKLKTPVSGIAEDVKITKKPLLICGLALLILCIVFLAVSSYVNIEMWLVSAVSAGVLIAVVLLIGLVRREKPAELGRALKRTPWELIPFVISMFLLVLSLEKYAVTDAIASGLGEKNVILTYGAASVIFANLINNIPMSVLFSAVLPFLNPSVMQQGIYAVVIGSNIGAFLTPIGALAGIMWLQILKKNDISFSFLRFLKYGVIIALPVLLAALSGLMISAAWI